MDELQIQQYVNEINSYLPQSPFVVDMIDKALTLATTKTPNPEALSSKLKLASCLAEYASKTSTEGFYQYHLPLAALLCDINPADWKMLDTSTGSVSNVVMNLTKFVSTTWKNRWRQILAAQKENSDILAAYLFATILGAKEAYETICNMPEDEKVITNEVFSTANMLLMGTAYLEVVIRTSGIQFPAKVLPLLNELTTLMVTKFDF